MNQQMIYDAQGIERCRLCAEATHKFLTKERQVIESRIVGLSGEMAYLESFINVLELQLSRPPMRQVQLPEQVQHMRIKIVAALKAQLKLVKLLMQYYTSIQMELVSSGVMATGLWQYAANSEQDKAVLQLIQ